jgi:hypothetical protein
VWISIVNIVVDSIRVIGERGRNGEGIECREKKEERRVDQGYEEKIVGQKAGITAYSMD